MNDQVSFFRVDAGEHAAAPAPVVAAAPPARTAGTATRKAWAA